MQGDVRKRIPGWLVSVILMTVVTGCGGGSHGTTAGRSTSAAAQPGDTQSGSTTAPGGGAGRSRFTADAERICERANREIIASENSNIGASEAVQLREIVKIAPGHAALERRAQAELTKLTPPAPLVSDWRSMLAARSRLAAELDTLIKAAKRKDLRAVEALIPVKKQTHSVLRTLASKNGFKECAEVGRGPATPANVATQSPL